MVWDNKVKKLISWLFSQKQSLELKSGQKVFKCSSPLARRGHTLAHFSHWIELEKDEKEMRLFTFLFSFIFAVFLSSHICASWKKDVKHRREFHWNIQQTLRSLENGPEEIQHKRAIASLREVLMLPILFIGKRSHNEVGKGWDYYRNAQVFLKCFFSWNSVIKGAKVAICNQITDRAKGKILTNFRLKSKFAFEKISNCENKK